MRHAIQTFTKAAAAATIALSAVACSSTPSPDKSKPETMAPPQPNAQMKAVLDSLASLNGKPIETLDAKTARLQPSPADAVMKLKAAKGMPTTPPPGVATVNRTVPGPQGAPEVPVRVYTPEGGKAVKPVILYVHGGGWVIATNDTYDASPRALAKACDAVVVSPEYRKAPEDKFPAAHEDVYAVSQWIFNNAKELNADPAEVAYVGESAGGNMVSAICLMAQDRGGKLPIHQVMVYPVTTGDLNTPSELQNANAKPLNRPMMQWFVKNTLAKPEDGKSKLIALVNAPKEQLAKMPPATIITASIDPLRSDGEMYAMKLKQAGVNVKIRNYDGVTHEFFGMADVVDEAKQAQAFAAGELNSAFE